MKQPSSINSLIVYFAIIAISCLIGGIMAELKMIGKKYSEIIMLFIAFFVGGFALLFIDRLYIIISISSMLVSTSFNLHISWTGEILPTKLRDLGFGLFVGMTRFGGFLSNFVFIAIVNINAQLTLWVYLITVVLIIVLLSFLPRNQIEELDSELKLDTESDIDIENGNCNFDGDCKEFDKEIIENNLFEITEEDLILVEK